MIRRTRVSEFLQWLRENGPVSWHQIQSAGFRSIFNGQTRKRLVANGVIVIERAVRQSPKSGAHCQYNLYSLSNTPYQPKRPGRKVGYRLTEEARNKMMIRSAETILRNKGYLVLPPEKLSHG